MILAQILIFHILKVTGDSKLEDDVREFNMNTIRNHRLLAANGDQEQIRVGEIVDCVLACLEKPCFSININLTREDGTLRCELLDTDRHNKSNTFIATQGIQHMIIKNPCDRSPCGDGNECIRVYESGDFICACVPGLTGRHCQKNIDECASNPCQNGATCTDHVNRYTCTCAPSYTWTNCQTHVNECASNPCQNGGTCTDHVNRYTCACAPGYTGTNCQTNLPRSCQSAPSDGVLTVSTSGQTFQVYCDVESSSKKWTLIARFSNADTKNWIASGSWWYTKTSAQGSTTSWSANTDMISPAFWLVKGQEFKLTQSNDSYHTPLLVSTGGCLGDKTFREKMASYGNFASSVWASDQCRGSCSVQFGGQYRYAHGFAQALCSGNIQAAYKVGFWCDYSAGDASVIMIGGGGSACHRADHGLAITEENAGSFGSGYDFGDWGSSTRTTTLYALNLWVRG